MKRLIIMMIMLVSALSTMAAGNSKPQDEKHLTAVFSYATFYQNEVGPYLETYISFDAWNMNFVKSDGKYQATVEVLLTVSVGDSIEIAKKYDLTSPKIASPDDNRFNFLDVQRFAIGNGLHTIRITLRDKNSTDEATVVEEQIAIYYDNKSPRLSSVQMMASVKPTTTENILSRNGYDMEPYVNDFLPEQIDQIHYYYELYNINREIRDEFVYSFAFVEVLETGKMIEATQTAQRLKRDALIPIFGSLDISKLPSGNYNLVVEIRDKDNNKLMYKKVPFFRSNPSVESIDMIPLTANFAMSITDESQINEYIEALAPIANEIERRNIYDLIHRPGLEEKQLFLYRFWSMREPLNAEGAWAEYRERIEYVNANFGWPKTKGIHTDRGRVYLQYGPPDHVRDEKNFVSTRGLMNAGQGHVYYLPYQLWRYNMLPGDDANRCFIFWDEFRSGFYKLLHSNAKGEVWDPKWEQRLSQQQLNEDVQGEVGDQFERGY